MLSGSIHGKRERAMREEQKGEGKETVLAMCVTKNLKEIRKKEGLAVRTILCPVHGVCRLCLYNRSMIDRVYISTFSRQTQLILVSSVNFMAQ